MSTEESWIGSTIDGRYAITKRLARGGMSTVYLARDERLHREVAMKVLFPHMAEDRKVVQRFEQEARNSALISHPNVVQVLDQGQTRETAYMVMEYVPGATLRTLLKRGPMTPRLTLAYAQAILSGLGAAHQAGLVHRDIKPENVLVSPEGRIKLADFGLARAATHNSGTSTLMGTVAYISPELLSGEGADERADIYAVGILIYEMLTGVQPYTGDSPVRVAFQHVNSTMPAPSSHIPGLAEPLDSLVRESTRSDPADRPKNADVLLEMLEQAHADLTDDDLDFDGALVKYSREQVDEEAAASTEQAAAETTAGATAASTTVMPAASNADQEQASEAESQSAEEVASGEDDATLAMGAEDFPTADDGAEWDDDVTAALGHASAPPEPQHTPVPHQTTPDADATVQFAAATPADSSTSSADGEQWSTLAEKDRQTVAEVPLPGKLSVDDRETSLHEPVEPPRRTYDPRADKKQRQKPLEQLTLPAPSRQGIALAVVVILAAVIMLVGYQLGVTTLLPSLPGGGE